MKSARDSFNAGLNHDFVHTGVSNSNLCEGCILKKERTLVRKNISAGRKRTQEYDLKKFGDDRGHTSTSGVNFINVFTLLRSQIQKAPKAAWLDCLFCAFGICRRKSCSLNYGEIDPWWATCGQAWDYWSVMKLNTFFYPVWLPFKLESICEWVCLYVWTLEVMVANGQCLSKLVCS